MRKTFVVLSLLIPATLLADEDPFRWDLQVRPEVVRPGEEFLVEATFLIPPRHHLYKDKTRIEVVSGDGFRSRSSSSSPAVVRRDPFYGKEMEVYEVGATIRENFSMDPGIAAGQREIRFLVAYQGCSESLCYREMRHIVPIKVTVEGASPAGASSVGTSQAGIKRHFLGRTVLAFLGGLATDFTPCVLPIIPITLAFIGVRRERRVLRNVFFTFIMVLSMSLTYAALGIAAASLGKSLGFLFQGIWFSALVAVFYLLFGLALLGFLPFQAPLPLRNRMARWGGEGVWGSTLTGVTIGFLAAPCVGPVIASILLFIAEEGDRLQGFLLLFSFGLGMGSLFLVASIFYHSLSGRMPGASCSKSKA